jgi:hypothetical protein
MSLGAIEHRTERPAAETLPSIERATAASEVRFR